MADNVINIDEDPANADWLRSRTWDMFVWRGDSKGLAPVLTLQDLLDCLQLEAEPIPAQKSRLRHFMSLPAAKPMPDALKNDVNSFIGATNVKRTAG